MTEDTSNTLRPDLRKLRQLCKKASREKDSRELVRLFEEIDDCLSELNSELREFFEEVEGLLRKQQDSSN